MKSLEFSIWYCMHHYHGLRHRCDRNGKDRSRHDECKGECEHWINRDGENHEQVLNRLVNELKGSLNLGESYQYYNPLTASIEDRYKCEYYPDEEKCKLCKHEFERKEE